MSPAVDRLETGEYMTRMDTLTGGTLVSGRCAGCGLVVSEGEPVVRYYRVGVAPKGERVRKGFFHAACAPVDDPRYVDETDLLHSEISLAECNAAVAPDRYSPRGPRGLLIARPEQPGVQKGKRKRGAGK